MKGIKKAEDVVEEKVEEENSIEEEELKRIASQLEVNIKIVGCGGGGSNTINRCVEAGIVGAQKCAINTDARHLLSVRADRKILIGKTLTKGLGAGGRPEIGEQAALENEAEIRKFLAGSDIVFVTAGMGGGTGSSASTVVAKIAKDMGALVVGIVSLPFSTEGKLKMKIALEWLDKLRKRCDTTIVVPNDKLLELAPRAPLEKAFRIADGVLMEAIKSTTEVVTKPGLVNLDYSDMRTIMKDGGMALIGLGESDAATNRIDEAVNEALTSPLLGKIDLSDAKGALIRVVGGSDMTISDAERAVELVNKKVSKTARILWGCSVDPELEKTVKVFAVITGIKPEELPFISGGFAKPKEPEEETPKKSAKKIAEKKETYERDIGFDIVR